MRKMIPCRTQWFFSQTLINLSCSRYNYLLTFLTTLWYLLCLEQLSHSNASEIDSLFPFFYYFFSLSLLCFRICVLSVEVLEKVQKGSCWLVPSVLSVTILTV